MHLKKITLFFLFLVVNHLSAQFEGPVFKDLKEALAQADEVVVLDLSNQKLDKFPMEILQLKKLQRLRLNNTFIRRLPEEIRQLKHLKALELNHLQEPNIAFEKLPSAIAELQELEYLGLIGLPSMDWADAMMVLEKLPKLDNLALMKNDFQHLPPGIEKITSLTKIWLGGNKQLNPQEVFDKLPGLEQIGFGGSEYKKLPKNTYKSVKLFNLWLANNQLKSIAPLQKNKALTQLTLNGNGLKKWPQGLEKLHLTALSLNNNPALKKEKIFPKIAKMKSLKYLSLSNNGLASLGQNLEQLAKLETLILRNNNFNETEQTKITNSLPTVKVVF